MALVPGKAEAFWGKVAQNRNSKTDEFSLAWLNFPFRKLLDSISSYYSYPLNFAHHRQYRPLGRPSHSCLYTLAIALCLPHTNTVFITPAVEQTPRQPHCGHRTAYPTRAYRPD